MPWTRRRSPKKTLQWRIAWRQHYAALCGIERPKDERERTFCREFAFRALALAMKNDCKVTQTIVREAGIEAVRRAGWRENKPKTMLRRAQETLSIPRTQRGIRDVFAEAGVDEARCGTALAEVINAPLDVEGPVSAGDKLKGVELFFKITSGFAPTKNANVNTNLHVDGFFDPKEYADTPPIATSAQQHNVTPEPPKKKRR